ncbi:opsin 8, group member a [Synchiropus picturatus]
MDEKFKSKLSPSDDFWAGVYLLIIAVLSVWGNAAVLKSAGRRSLKAPELLTVNLAVTDMGMALSMYPLSVFSAFNHGWVGGHASCLYYGLMGMIFSITSIMTLAVMGLVRYLATGNPPMAGFKFQRQTVNILICGIWIYAFLWALLPLLGWGSYGPEPFGLACSVDWTGYSESINHSTFIIALSILCTFLPCLTILFSYFGIAWKLHRAYRSMQNIDCQCGNIEKRITLMALMISTGFLLAWTPYVVVSFWSMIHTQDQDHLSPFITLLPCLFAKSSTVYNPFIYFIFQRNFGAKTLHTAVAFCCSGRSPHEGKEGGLDTSTAGGCKIHHDATPESVMEDRSRE